MAVKTKTAVKAKAATTKTRDSEIPKGFRTLASRCIKGLLTDKKIADAWEGIDVRVREKMLTKMSNTLYKHTWE